MGKRQDDLLCESRHCVLKSSMTAEEYMRKLQQVPNGNAAASHSKSAKGGTQTEGKKADVKTVCRNVGPHMISIGLR